MINKRILSEMGTISSEVYDNDPAGIRYFKDNPDDMLVQSLFGITSYKVIDYTPPSPTSMQALLLRKTGSNEYVIAFRGTQEVLDVLTDIKIGLENYNPQFEEAKAFVQSALERTDYNITKNNLTLTGHSLGGILTQSVGAVMEIKGYAFNPYGTERLLTMWSSYTNSFSEALLNLGLYKVLNAFGLDSEYAEFATNNIFNVSFNDFGIMNGDILSNFASALSSDHLGTYLPVFGENTGLSGHSIGVLNKAIKDYSDILNSFTIETSYNDLSNAYSLAGINGFTRLNNFLEDLRIKETLPNSLSFDFPDLNTIDQLNYEEPKHFYSLLNMIPIVVEGELERYNEINPSEYSNTFVDNRIDFLFHLIHGNTTDVEFVDNNVHITLPASSQTSVPKKYIFGTDQTDPKLYGQQIAPRDDHLFGLNGNDTIKGFHGNDTIEGGKGRDTMEGGPGNDTFLIVGEDEDYDVFIGGGGTDTIQGSDGNDVIRVHRFDDSNSIECIKGGLGDDILAGTSGADKIDFSGTDVQDVGRIEGGAGSDELVGSSGDDTIYGHAQGGTVVDDKADDTLTGGAGNDHLIGGDGIDTYNYTLGDGNDRITDSGKNRIVIRDAEENQTLLSTFHFVEDSVWQTADGQIQLVNQNGGWEILMPDGGSIELVNGFTEGDFGISLVGPSAPPDPNRTILGDLQPVDDDPNTPGVQFKYDDLGNVVVDPGSPAPGREDLLYDSEGSDLVLGGAGNDFIAAHKGGDDIMQGGEGRDIIASAAPSGAPDNDIIEGGDDGDVILAGPGDDRAFGETLGETWELISQGNTADSLDGKGDLISGDTGNDQLFGSNRTDALFGGQGKDLLVGMGGNDFLLGDHVLTQAFRDWNLTLSQTYDLQPHALSFAAPTGDADQIHAGTGNDYVQAGGGDDVIDAGDGDDVVFGGDGNDHISGGRGNDELAGDGGVHQTALKGRDIIDGGAGDDRIFGGRSDDTLFGGDGNDLVSGDAGNDLIYGGAGNDQLQGGAGNDHLEGEAGNDTLIGQAGHDVAYGGQGDDVIEGYDGDDRIFGEQGNDTLRGNKGRDYLSGGEGDDMLSGGPGFDILEGGPGSDYYNIADNGIDIIIDDDFNYYSNSQTTVDLGEDVKPGSTTIQWIDGGIKVTVGDGESSFVMGNPGTINSSTLISGYEGYSSLGWTYGDLIFNGRQFKDRSIPTGFAFPLTSSTHFLMGGSTLNGGAFLASSFDRNERAYARAGAVAPPRRLDPLILDLDGDGIETIRINTDTYFDHDGDGFAERTGWVAEDDGLLVLDRNNDGRITHGNELFGDNTLLKSAQIASGGFEALAEHDANNDGVISSLDPIFPSLQVWQDVDGNALSDPGELHDLSSLGIEKISLASQPQGNADSNGNTLVSSGTFSRQNGTSGTVAELRLQRNLKHTIDPDQSEVPEDIAALPWLAGSGTVKDLHQAMVADQELEGLIRDFTAETDLDVRNDLIDQILAHWTGNETVEHNSRGGFFDGKKLAVIESFMGRPFSGASGPNPNRNAVVHLEGIFQRIRESSYAQLMAQTHLKGLLGKVRWVQDETTHLDSPDLSEVAASLQGSITADPEAGKALLSDFARILRGSISRSSLAYLNFRETFLQMDPALAWAIDSGGLKVIESRAGTDGNDALRNVQGDYSVVAGEGEDVVYGADTGESIVQNEGDSLIVAGDGNDTVSTSEGADILDGGAGRDWLSGGQGNDTYIFRRGSGRDQIADLDRQPNTDAVYMGSFLTPDDIQVIRSDEELLLKIKDSEDQLTIINWFAEDDYQIEHIQFADGTIWGVDELKERALVGTPDADTLIGYASDDSVSGLAGNDTLFGKEGDDVLSGGDGQDTLDGGAGDDMYDGGSGNDTYEDPGGSDVYAFGFGSGNDTIFDHAASSADFDAIHCDEDIHPDDVILTRDNFDLVLLLNDSDSLRVSGFFDPHSSAEQIEEIRFADGTAWDVTAMKKKVLRGTDGPDRITGYASDDVLEGLEGADFLVAGAGNDVLDGGPGNDHLYGENGEDGYIFCRGCGQDIIHESGNDGETDRILIAADLSPQDIQLKRIDRDLHLEIIGTQDRLQVAAWFVSPSRQIEQIVFADGTTWDPEMVQSLMLQASESNDHISGTYQADLLDGGGGNDWIWGYGGDDTLYGGMGDDVLYGHSGNDALHGGPGFDQLLDTIGANTFEGGPGNDIIHGTSGRNTYLVNRSDGFDTIHVRLPHMIEEDGTVLFGDGISPDDLSIQAKLTESGSSWTAELAIGIGNDEGVHITGQGSGSGDFGYYDGEWGYGSVDFELSDLAVKRFVFADGREMSLEEVLDMADSGVIGVQSGTTGDDILTGSVAQDEIYAGEGNDAIESRDQNDRIEDGNGDDVVSLGSGKDDIYNGYGNDIIAGEKGDDWLNDGPGSDVFVFNKGDGADWLNNAFNPGAEDVDTLSFGNDIRTEDILAHVDSSGRVVLSVDGSEDSISLEWFDGDVEDQPNKQMRGQFLGYAQAQVFDLAGIIRQNIDALLAASASAPVPLLDAVSSDFILTEADAVGGDHVLAYAQTGDLFAVPTHYQGTDGDDVITGRAGNDTLEGGPGDDLLAGGDGDDTYIFQPGDGRDVVDEVPSPDAHNSFAFGPGITPDDITLDHDQASEQLVLRIGTGGDEVRINHFSSQAPYGPHAIERFQFDDGTILTWDQLIDKGFDIIGTQNDDTLQNTAAVDRIFGHDGDDVLAGGLDNDLLTGGTGDDTYLYNSGDGVDTIVDSAGPSDGNMLIFGEGITPDDLANNLTYSGNTLIIRTGTSGDEVHLSGFDPDQPEAGPRAVQRFRFADGTELGYEDIIRNTFILQGDAGNDHIQGTAVTDRLYGYEGADILEGKAGDDVLTGGEDDDTLRGGSGDDAYILHIGDGKDTIADTSTLEEGNRIVFGTGITENDLHFSLQGTTLTIAYGPGNDAVRLLNFDYNRAQGSHVVQMLEFAGGSEVRLLDLIDPGTAGDDLILGTPLDDAIDAGGGNDLVYSGKGHDTLSGGSGNDMLHGEDGDDTLTGGPGDDTLDGGAGNDIYAFNTGDGRDVISDLSIPGAGNTIRFGSGIAADDLSLSYQADRLVISIKTTGDRIELMHFDHEDVHGSRAVDGFVFADGTTMSYEELLAHGFDLTGTSNADAIAGTNVTDRITGLEGDDFISAGNGDDNIAGGEGNDVIETGNGADTVDGGPGNDTVKTSDDGNIILGSPGDDVSLGGSGADSYHLGLEDGADTIHDAGGNDTLVVDDGLTVDDIFIVQEEDDLSIVLPDGSTTVIEDWALQESTVENIRFGDEPAQLLESLLVLRARDYEVSLDEDTTLSGIIELTCPGPNVRFSVKKASGHGTFTIDEQGMWGFVPADDYYGTDSVVVEITNDRGETALSTITFDVLPVNDAPTLDPAFEYTLFGDGPISGSVQAEDVDGDILSYSITRLPEHGSIQIDDLGNWSFDPLDGFCGTDNALITVDDGNGGVAETRLDFAVNIYQDGNVLIPENGPKRVSLDGVGKNELTFTRHEQDLMIDVLDRGAITVSGYFTAPENGIETLLTSDGPINLGKDTILEKRKFRPGWLRKHPEANEDERILICGTDKTDALKGANASDILFGQADHDNLKGEDGDDLLIGGNGRDIIFGSNGQDTLYGDDDRDKLHGGDGDDALIGGDGDDMLQGEEGDDLLWGGKGNDTLMGHHGDDFLWGGSGDDVLKGDFGSDVYWFEKGDGRDMLHDHSGGGKPSKDQVEVDTINFGISVHKSDVAFYMHGSKLHIQYGEEDLVEVKGQGHNNSSIEKVELADGSYLTDIDIEKILQDMSAYAVNEGIALGSVGDVRKNEELMTLISNSWHQA